MHVEVADEPAVPLGDADLEVRQLEPAADLLLAEAGLAERRERVLFQ
jgi:hypothetical protein